jgi:lipase chaperone LimK
LTVVLRVYRDAGGRLGGFTDDLHAAVDEAHQKGRLDEARELYSLFIDYFLVQLGSMNASELDRYLSDREVWKETDEALVFRTPDAPSIAFGVQAEESGVWTVTALAISRDAHGGSHETWWDKVVEPRVRSL